MPLSTVAEKTIKFIDNTIDRVLILLFLLIFLVGCYFVADTGYVYMSVANGGIKGHQQERDVEEIVKELDSGFVAWLKIEDSPIDYPIMQGEDNAKYLNTDPYGDYSIAGSIFEDCRNASDFSDPYTITYGHHMTNDYMFGALDHFEDQEYFDSHRKGTLTINGVDYELNIFAFGVMQATEKEVFNPDYANNVLSYLERRADIYYPPGDGQIVLLSTCRDPGLTTRTLVFAEILNYNPNPMTDNGG